MTEEQKQQLKEFHKDLLKETNPKKGEIWMADLGETVGSIQGGIRPVVIVSNNTGNVNSTTANIVPITTKAKNILPTHFDLINYYGLEHSTVLCEQITTICKSQLLEKKCNTTYYLICKVNQKLLHTLGIKAEIKDNNSYQIEDNEESEKEQWFLKI